jgi:transcriptional antiterminator
MTTDRSSYQVYKVLNNNVLLALDLAQKKEVILVGKGIGYGCKTHEIIHLELNRIDKIFRYYDQNIQNNYLRLIEDLDGIVLGLSEEMIAYAERELGPLNSHIHIALADHIGFAMERLKEGLEIDNPFSEEVKVLYQAEYRIGIYGAKMIEERLGVRIPDAEIAFITMHLNAARQNKRVTETVKFANILKDLIKVIEEELDIVFDYADLSYQRLLTHLRFSFNRIVEGKGIQNSLLDKIKHDFTHSYALAERLGKIIEERLEVTVPEDEIGFIALHLYRLEALRQN